MRAAVQVDVSFCIAQNANFVMHCLIIHFLVPVFYLNCALCGTRHVHDSRHLANCILQYNRDKNASRTLTLRDMKREDCQSFSRWYALYPKRDKCGQMKKLTLGDKLYSNAHVINEK